MLLGIRYNGNRKPRLKRLKKSKSIWVNYGLKNQGTEKVLYRLKKDIQLNFVYGLSIAKTNSQDTCNDEVAINDYIKSFEYAMTQNFLQFITINISCPNAFGGEPFTSVEKLKKLLSRLDEIERSQLVFIKMPISINNEVFLNLLKEIDFHKIDGVVIGNLQKNKTGDYIKDKLDNIMMQSGEFSGKPTFDRSNELIKLTFQKYSNRFVIIGCGGVFNAEDAYTKIKLGASLVQMVTGVIFEGPTIVNLINRSLVNLLKKDGFATIQDAIGIDA